MVSTRVPCERGRPSCFSKLIHTKRPFASEVTSWPRSQGLACALRSSPLIARFPPFPACNLDVILGFDGSRTQNVFVAQKGLESKVDAILNRLSQMQRLSCGGGQTPRVRVAVVASTPAGPVEAFDFAEYQPELLEKFRLMRSQHPYVLTADALKVYQHKFRQASPDSVKVSAAPAAERRLGLGARSSCSWGWECRA